MDIFSLFRRYILDLQERFLSSLSSSQAFSAGGGAYGAGVNSSSAADGGALGVNNSCGSSSALRNSKDGSHPQHLGLNSSSSSSSPPTDFTSLLELQMSFLSFTLTLFPGRVDCVDQILASTVQLLSRCGCRADSAPGGGGGAAAGGGKKKLLSPAGVEAVVEILSSPLRSFSLSVLEIEHFPALMSFLDFSTRKQGMERGGEGGGVERGGAVVFQSVVMICLSVVYVQWNFPRRAHFSHRVF